MRLRPLYSLLCALTLAAQHSDTALKNPFQSPDDRARGGAFYRSQCASCHGIDGKGGAGGPNLSTGRFRHASNDEGLFRVITKGVAGTSMPGFSMNGREIWQIVSFVRGLTVSGSGGINGDARAGRQHFEANGCVNCHWLNGTGAPRGLDLSAIGFGHCVEMLGRQEIGIDQRGKQHPCEEGTLKTGILALCCQRRWYSNRSPFRQRTGMILPASIGLDLTGDQPV